MTVSRITGSGLAAAGFCLLLAPAPAAAGALELSGWVGPSLPFYSQNFQYQPPAVPPLPGFSVEQVGEFKFDAGGGVSFGAGLAWQFAGPLGVELRIDSGAIDITQDGALFQATVHPPAPLPPVRLDVETKGTVQLDRLLPVSLDLRYRGGGRVGVVASAGVSYLPALDFAVTQELVIGAIGGLSGLQLPTVPLEAGGTIDGFWGANAGLGVRFRLTEAVSLTAEGRGFFFGEREVKWHIEKFPVSPAVGEAIRQQLDPIRFTPGFFQATVGLGVRF
jgi:hypothetical protein